ELDTRPFEAGLARGQRQAVQFAQQTTRSTAMMRQGFANLGLQIQDVVVSLQSGQAPLRVFVQQGRQIASAFGPVGIGLGTAAALATSLGSALLGARNDAREAAEAMDRFKVSLDRQIESVDAAKVSFRELSAAQRELLAVKIAEDIRQAEQAQREFTGQLRALARGLSEVGSIATAGPLLQLRDSFLAGRISAAEFASGIAQVRDEATGPFAEQIEQAAEEVREIANRLLEAQL